MPDGRAGRWKLNRTTARQVGRTGLTVGRTECAQEDLPPEGSTGLSNRPWSAEIPDTQELRCHQVAG